MFGYRSGKLIWNILSLKKYTQAFWIMLNQCYQTKSSIENLAIGTSNTDIFMVQLYFTVFIDFLHFILQSIRWLLAFTDINYNIVLCNLFSGCHGSCDSSRNQRGPTEGDQARDAQLTETQGQLEMWLKVKVS